MLPQSNRVETQVQKHERRFVDEHGTSCLLKLEIHFDDRCHNGHNTFSMTSNLFYLGKWQSGGCQHDLVAEIFPEFAKYIKWHLTSTDGPLHYVANTMYWKELRNLGNARASAVWPSLESLEEVTTETLLERLPALMEEFKKDMEELGFNY